MTDIRKRKFEEEAIKLGLSWMDIPDYVELRFQGYSQSEAYREILDAIRRQI